MNRNTTAGLSALALALLLGGCGEQWVDPSIQECRDAGGVAAIHYQVNGMVLRNCAFPCLAGSTSYQPPRIQQPPAYDPPEYQVGAERFRPGYIVEVPKTTAESPCPGEGFDCRDWLSGRAEAGP